MGIPGVIAAVTVATVLAGADTPPADSRVVVLDTYSVWRLHCTLAPPVLASGERVDLKIAWLNFVTPAPAENWHRPDFDDGTWHRGPVTLACKSALVSRLCLRGKFTVTHPSAVKGLSLSAAYHGGLIVWVNGKELRRQHVAAGAALAEGPAGEKRDLTDLAIPVDRLRKGVNVIGLEILRAPYAERPKKGTLEDKREVELYEENPCEILSARLSASSGAGLIPNAVRPEGFQVWNADTMAVDFGLDRGDRAEPLRPVTIVGARNGLFTGKVVVGSTRPIHGLKVTSRDLSGPGGAIDASHVRIRYGLKWGRQALVHRVRNPRPSPYPTWANRLGALAPEAPETFEVQAPTRGRYSAGFEKTSGRVEPVSGAVVPVWITVKTPAHVSAGTYTGKVTIAAEGEKPVDVPVELQVADWTLPGTQDFRTWTDIIQCPDTLALEYKVPLWSDRHFELIARSFSIIGETGSRTVYIPLIAHTNFGNEESMVRWIDRKDHYEYDFSVMERYLDVAEKNMGPPKALIFVVWDVYMMGAADETADSYRRYRQGQIARHVSRKGGTFNHGPMVTLLDPATGKTENVGLPRHAEATASKTLWKPLFDELRQRLRKRNLEKRMMLGVECDAWATKQEHQLFHEITNGASWVIQSHEGHPPDKRVHGISPVGYQARVWGVSFSDAMAYPPTRRRSTSKSQGGWKQPGLVAQFDRFMREDHPNVRWRHLAESIITGGQRGPGRLGGEYWRAVRDRRGERRGRAFERYPESTWRNLHITDALLAPGPKGPVATDRLEAYQECEARIVIERALGDKTLHGRLGQDLARRCEEYLHARHMMMWLSLSNLQLYLGRKGRRYLAYEWRPLPNLCGSRWFLCSNWRQRTAQVYSLAGEVTRKLKSAE